MIHNCLPHPWDPELDRLRRELQRARIEDEKRRIRDEINRLNPHWPYPLTPCIPLPCVPPSVITWFPPVVAPASPSIEDVLRAIPAR